MRKPPHTRTNPLLRLFRRQEVTPDQQAFYDVMRAFDEQAVGLALQTQVVATPTRRPWYRLTRRRAVLWLVLLLLLAVLGWWAWTTYGVEEEPAPVAAPAPEPAKPLGTGKPPTLPVKQKISWTEAQVKTLPYEARVKVEERLSLLLKEDTFPGAQFNFAFVPGVNAAVKRDDGSLAISGFFHNGFLKDVVPRQVRISCYVDDRILFEKVFTQGFDTWHPDGVYYMDLLFSKDDIRNPETLDRLLVDAGRLRLWKFVVLMDYEMDGRNRHAGDEGVWTYVNAITLYKQS